MSRIIKLEAENIKRLKAVTLYLKDGATLIGGRNGQGKSSTLDCIAIALGGAEQIPDEPIRRGAKKAHIVVQTTELLVERKFSSKGSKLIVRNNAGVEQKSPQALLDSLYGSLAFDPLKFATEKPPKQAETIRRLAGLDFSELDAERQEAFDQRTEANRETKRLSAVLGGLRIFEGVPVVEVSVDDLRKELANRNEQQAAKSQRERETQRAHGALDRCRLDYSIATERLEDLEKKLQAQKNAMAALRAEVLEKEEAHAAAIRAFEEFTPEPVEETLQKLSSIEETNRKVRANSEQVAHRLKLAESEELAEQLTAKIEAIDEKKASLIEAAKLPVPGLGFDENGPTLNGIALQQCSQAERLRVSVAIGIAFSPKLKLMLVREGAFLDEDSLALLAQLAEEAGAQVIIERVGSGDEGAIIIEDGMVVASEVKGAAE